MPHWKSGFPIGNLDFPLEIWISHWILGMCILANLGMCILANLGVCVHELAHRTRVFARMCLRVLRGVRECGLLKCVSWWMLGCARMSSRIARVCSPACVRVSSRDLACPVCSRTSVRARVHACLCSRALKEFAIPRESSRALKEIRVPEDRKLTSIIYIHIREREREKEKMSRLRRRIA